MRELKVWYVDTIESEGNYVEFYEKSEADKVIAELKEKLKEQTSIAEEGWKEFRTYHTCYAEAVKELYDKNKEIAELKADYKEACDRLQTANLIKDEQLAATRHQKYKRCFGKAQEWRNYAAFCGMQSHCHNHRGFGKTAEKYTWKEIHGWKCVKRWLKIAEQFKEAK